MNFSFEKYEHKEEKTEMVTINGKMYSLTNKPSDNYPSPELEDFTRDQWEKPRQEFNPKLYKAFKIEEIDIIRGDDEKIIALCAYKLDRGISDGVIDITLVREDYRNRSGIGAFLTKRATDKIIEFQEKKDHFIPPVMICVDTETQEGYNLIKKIQEEYKDRVLFQIEESYKKEENENEGIFSAENSWLDRKNNTILIYLSKNYFDLVGIREIAEEKGFDEKDEFHITVSGFKNGLVIKDVLEKLSPEESKAKLDKIQDFISHINWNFKLLEGVYHISKEYKMKYPENDYKEIIEKRESYIQRIDILDLNFFYEKLNNLLGTNLQPPPAHVTLFTNGSDKEKAKMGIGIYSEAELAELKPELIFKFTDKE